VDDLSKDALRNLPSVDAVLQTAAAGGLIDRYGRQATTGAVRAVLAQSRTELQGGGSPDVSVEHVAEQALARLEAESGSKLLALFNLTGTVLHTNFGRAVLAEAAIEAAIEAMRNTVALEFDLESGKRGERDDHVKALICELTGAENATLVNNNAAAVLLALHTLAAGRQAIVSRGELIEIGGAFRMPDIMQRAGAQLIEVGTTNRTHAKDYKTAINAQTGVILKVHTSNYRITGFTAEVGAEELAAIAAAAKVPVLHDLGSGTLVDLKRYGLPNEPTVRQTVAHADLVTFSGDKLLGGPQAGFIVGRRELIAAVNRNPMKRALRVDKIRLAAIAATLKLYRDPDRLAERLPTLQLLARPQADIAAQAARILPAVKETLGDSFSVKRCDCHSQIGSGALPVETIASAGLCIRPQRPEHGIERLAAALRALRRPIIGRMEDGALILDLRCLNDEAGLLAALSTLDAQALG
jgi:L-seryl-tRNA(Ser) seleniumtransferase